ncbi:hypothetical protein K435DRAFT_844838 [Dendrothele bispora CBS 962.96]|uniref:Uncharacterized protein n=1 Tax=Dendrothele bispora (strain CBS 962.96) TaxID=1314807 RepID=A0A4S8KZ09_DENBC|nr:hypothetical protein K435DRAFT_844838 [Dendrothele bispora CBS 962.96]
MRLALDLSQCRLEGGDRMRDAKGGTNNQTNKSSDFEICRFYVEALENYADKDAINPEAERKLVGKIDRRPPIHYMHALVCRQTNSGFAAMFGTKGDLHLQFRTPAVRRGHKVVLVIVQDSLCFIYSQGAFEVVADPGLKLASAGYQLGIGNKLV